MLFCWLFVVIPASLNINFCVKFLYYFSHYLSNDFFQVFLFFFFFNTIVYLRCAAHLSGYFPGKMESAAFWHNASIDDKCAQARFQRRLSDCTLSTMQAISYIWSQLKCFEMTVCKWTLSNSSESLLPHHVCASRRYHDYY